MMLFMASALVLVMSASSAFNTQPEKWVSQPLVSFGIAVHNAAQPLGIALVGIEHREFDQLIADEPGAAIHWLGEQALELRVGLGASDEECHG